MTATIIHHDVPPSDKVSIPPGDECVSHDVREIANGTAQGALIRFVHRDGAVTWGTGMTDSTPPMTPSRQHRKAGAPTHRSTTTPWKSTSGSGSSCAKRWPDAARRLPTGPAPDRCGRGRFSV
ncbi:hypothetical protein MCNS_16320 [Mycobacterium conspicuum]|uniref:Uncharacterized protein n=1 Tax=Mycobacterium conspicuum TaxID=44010 RepID=A0A7I7YA34_9MYCO|nr:hypothetical protein MCNS_16320 [Mycobacterium conspicuum]